MVSYQRKLRAGHATCVWGAEHGASPLSAQLTLTLEVDSSGESFELVVKKAWWFVCWTTKIGLVMPGEVCSLNLFRAVNVIGRPLGKDDALLTCTVLSSH